MTKGLTFTHIPKGNKLGITQVDNLCRKHSALIIRVMRQTPLTLVQISWIHGRREQFMRGGIKKVRVSNSSIRMSWGRDGKTQRGSF